MTRMDVLVRGLGMQEVPDDASNISCVMMTHTPAQWAELQEHLKSIQLLTLQPQSYGSVPQTTAALSAASFSVVPEHVDCMQAPLNDVIQWRVMSFARH